jgi:hypothetical protein
MRFSVPVLAAVALLGLSGCATTSFQSTWRNPEAQPVTVAGRKIAAVVMTRNPVNRHPAETALAAEITKRGAIGIPSYTILKDENPADPEAAQKELVASGVDGIVTMRVIARDRQTTYVPGQWTKDPHYHTWAGYWGHGWGQVYEPGYLQTDTFVSVETTVYSVVQNKLLWAGMSETINPSRADALVRELADRVAGQLEKEGLLPR